MPLRFIRTHQVLAAAGFFLVAAIVMTWPLALHLGSRIAADQGDPVFNSWVLAWTAGLLLRAATGDPAALASYWHGNIFHPEPLTLAYSEHLTAQALQILPIYAVTGNILTVYNLLFIATFALSGVGMFVFVRELTGRPLAALIAGVAFAWALYRLGQFPHVQVLSSYWMPLALFGFRRYFAAGRVRALAGGAGALVLQNLSCGYFLLFFPPFAAAYCLYEMAARRRLLDRRTWLHLLAAAAAVALLTLPFVLPYLQLREIRDLGVRSRGEIAMFSADTHAFASIAAPSRLLGEIRAGYQSPEGEGFVGFTIFACALVGATAGLVRLVRTTPWRAMPDWQVLAAALGGLLAIAAGAFVVAMFVNGQTTFTWRGDRVIYRDASTPLAYAVIGALVFVVLRFAARRHEPAHETDAAGFFVAAAIAAGLLALGPTMHALGRGMGPGPYAILLEFVPGFDGLRVPARFLMLVACFLAVLAGLGAARLLRPGPAGRVLAAVLVAGMLAETWPAPIDMNQPVLPHEGLVVPPRPASGRQTPAIYRAVRALPDSTVLVELPFGDEAYDIMATFYAGFHRQALVNGYSGFFPESYHENSAALRDPLADPARAIETLRASGATHVLLHEAAFTHDRGRAIAEWLLASGATLASEDGSDRLFVLQ